ncbi:MAG: hypothetical protein JSW07_05175 [bacterium]|nr:MAG: hypothetical protein JSW07_05175 [bacterium]
MNKESNIAHGFRLRVTADSEPTIFYWPIIPESIQDIQTIDSGGAKVIVKLPDGSTITHEVIESKEEIESRIAKCKELDEKYQDANHTS